MLGVSSGVPLKGFGPPKELARLGATELGYGRDSLLRALSDVMQTDFCGPRPVRLSVSRPIPSLARPSPADLRPLFSSLPGGPHEGPLKSSAPAHAQSTWVPEARRPSTERLRDAARLCSEDPYRRRSYPPTGWQPGAAPAPGSSLRPGSSMARGRPGFCFAAPNRAAHAEPRGAMEQQLRGVDWPRSSRDQQ